MVVLRWRRGAELSWTRGVDGTKFIGLLADLQNWPIQITLSWLAYAARPTCLNGSLCQTTHSKHLMDLVLMDDTTTTTTTTTRIMWLQVNDSVISTVTRSQAEDWQTQNQSTMKLSWSKPLATKTSSRCERFDEARKWVSVCDASPSADHITHKSL